MVIDRVFFKSQADIVRAIINSHNTIWKIEVPAGLINSTNKTFIASQDILAGSLQVYLDGERIFDYIYQAPRTVVLDTAPTSGTVRLQYVTPDQTLPI